MCVCVRERERERERERSEREREHQRSTLRDKKKKQKTTQHREAKMESRKRVQRGEEVARGKGERGSVEWHSRMARVQRAADMIHGDCNSDNALMCGCYLRNLGAK